MTTGRVGRLARIVFDSRSAFPEAIVRIEENGVDVAVLEHVVDPIGPNVGCHVEPAAVQQEPCHLDEALVAARDEDVPLRIGLERAVRRPTLCFAGRAPRSPGDAVADLEPAPLALAGGELDDLAGAAARCRLERAQRVLDPHHDLLVIDEHDIDRKSHERGVDRPGRAEHQPVPRLEPPTPEEAAHSPAGRVRDLDRLADDPAVLAAQRQDAAPVTRHRARS